MTESGYSVIRYIPDAARGESLNIGVLVWAFDDFRIHIDQKAVQRVITENPRLAKDALLQVEPMLREQLSTAVAALPSRIRTLLSDEHRFPVDLTEARFTTIDMEDEEHGLDATVERLTKRVVRPRRRTSRSGQNPTEILEGRLRPQIAQHKVERHHFFEKTKTGVPRAADFYANSGENIALDVARLAITKADDIVQRADAQAFKVYDVLTSDKTVREYYVYCVFEDENEEPNEIARQVIESPGATVLTDLDDAVMLLGGRP